LIQPDVRDATQVGPDRIQYDDIAERGDRKRPFSDPDYVLGSERAV